MLLEEKLDEISNTLEASRRKSLVRIAQQRGVCLISTTCKGTAAFTSYGITVVQELTTQIDTDRATGVKLANGHFLEMHEVDFKKSSCFQFPGYVNSE
jgi:hypothetical protein